MQTYLLSARGRPVNFCLLSLALLGLTACSSAWRSRERADPLPLEPVLAATDARNACLAWSRPLGAHVSHVSLSRDAKRIYVSTSAERGSPAGLRLIDARGKVLWFRPLPQPVKAQSVSDDGALLVANTYDAKLRAFDATGKQLWEREHLGRPLVLSRAKRVLLINDDDSEPGTAFVSYDYGGRLKGGARFTHDDPGNTEPLDTFVMNDESGVAIAFSGTAVELRSPDGSLEARGELDDSAISIAATGTPAPTLYALTSDQFGGSQTLIRLDGDTRKNALNPSWRTTLDRRYETIQLIAGIILAYGNTPRGQTLAAFDGASGRVLWRRSYDAPAPYSSRVLALRNHATVFIDDGQTAGEIKLLAVDRSGMAAWQGVIPASSGVYSYDATARPAAAAVGAGDPGKGVLRFYRMKRSPCR